MEVVLGVLMFIVVVFVLVVVILVVCLYFVVGGDVNVVVND